MPCLPSLHFYYCLIHPPPLRYRSYFRCLPSAYNCCAYIPSPTLSFLDLPFPFQRFSAFSCPICHHWLFPTRSLFALFYFICFSYFFLSYLSLFLYFFSLTFAALLFYPSLPWVIQQIGGQNGTEKKCFLLFCFCPNSIFGFVDVIDEAQESPFPPSLNANDHVSNPILDFVFLMPGPALTDSSNSPVPLHRPPWAQSTSRITPNACCVQVFAVVIFHLSLFWGKSLYENSMKSNYENEMMALLEEG